MRPIVLFFCVLFALGLSACAAEVADVGGGGPVKSEVVLKIDQGVVFSTGAITNGAAFQASDLVVVAHQQVDVDLKPGVEPNSTDHVLMHVFRTGDQATSANAVFDDLDSVPALKPSGAIMGDFLRRAGNGNGCVVQNNMSKGYTKVFVDMYNAPGKQVRLKYLVFD